MTAFNMDDLHTQVYHSVRKALGLQARSDHYLRSISDAEGVTLASALNAGITQYDAVVGGGGGGGGGGQTPLAASDDFARADSTSILGPGWTLYGTGVGGVHSGTGYFVSGTTLAAKGKMRDGTVSVSANSQDFGAVNVYVAFHIIDQNNMMFLGSSGNSHMSLYSKVAGSNAIVLTFDFGSGFFSNSDPKTIAAVVTGKSVGMYAGGVLRATATIPDDVYAALAAGYDAGIAADDTSRGFNTNFDDYSVVPA